MTLFTLGQTCRHVTNLHQGQKKLDIGLVFNRVEKEDTDIVSKEAETLAQLTLVSKNVDIALTYRRVEENDNGVVQPKN